MEEIVERKTTLLLDQQNRLSIHDLTNKFEKGLTTAAKLSEEARIRKATPLGKHAMQIGSDVVGNFSGSRAAASMGVECQHIAAFLSKKFLPQLLVYE
ncbi:hypothetical protein J1N35_003383 [Gossypium stocksii]|uniref:Stomatal closure-related actin-binding protein actin-binding domain-containing protein n=1 Tax=Gossypium stocksii TaxID=47602 RepID=A0A9D3WP71_9ROSI|nr:hypothetical protein J1N35_003383 [Gossypium stocksii]